MAWSVAFAMVLAGCAPPSASNSIAVREQGPDGNQLAVLVDRTYLKSRSSDEFFLLVVHPSANLEEAIAPRDIWNSSALVATNAERVKLQWQGNDTLRVICDSCELRPIDIEPRVDRLGAVTIVYEGVPEAPMH